MKDSLQEKLDRLKVVRAAQPGPDCPDETQWRELAAGLLPEAKAKELVEHSTGCDACGLLLRQATEDFASEETAHETEQLSSLPTSQPQWQQAKALELAEQAKRAKRFVDWSFLSAWKPQVS